MARIRSIKPGFFLNEDAARLPYEWRLLFIGLWTQADREGRLEDRPQRLKASLFPYDNVDINEGLEALVVAGFIQRYRNKTQHLIAIPTWKKHQQPHIRESVSELPAPKTPCRHRAGTSPAHQIQIRGTDPDPDPDPVDSVALMHSTTPPVLTFPCVGHAKQWDLSQPQLDNWQQAYPNLDVVAECRKSLAWINTNNDRKKTAKGMPSFLVAWLNRAVDYRSVSVRGRPGGAIEVIRASNEAFLRGEK